MGISGLLPLLKSIQVNKHLSEFAGQTLAVDAYVWLHRGVYACATELATGKPTTRYVDYAMHRIRLLRHHHIQPYVVFDGGPLPAKKGTEVERKQKRDENLARGNALATQGKHTQAREYYVKCIDVTPQMAFQLIKALRAESVPYVVAPYEADAQLAYLERIGLVDGIITEDSDLLVFGCRTVLFKLDTVSSTLTAISRADFGSVASSDGGISLLGWSDVEFRAMAILSGCDYLPSIPGIGLKTAWTLLRKYKTAENVVRAVRLEGKKTVPKGYLEKYRLAEKVFLHQRVYDPVGEKLVHLTDIPDGELWNEEHEAYVGRDIEPSLAKKVAEGDADPMTLKSMEDINSGYVPRAVKSIPFSLNDLNQANKNQGKGKAKAKSTGEGILSFFGPKPIIPPIPKTSFEPMKPKPMVVGRASGKRTLADVMDQDIAIKRKRQEAAGEAASGTPIQSRFFGVASRLEELLPEAGPSRLREEKENIPLSEVEGDEDVPTDKDVVLDKEETLDSVAQEDGYISLSPSSSRFDTPDLSSPLRATSRRGITQDDFGADAISSPPVKHHPHRPRSLDNGDLGKALVRDTPPPPVFAGPDLRDSFGDDLTSEIDCFEEDEPRTTTPTPSPVTPEDTGQENNEIVMAVDGEVVSDLDEVEQEASASATRSEIVANGWWHKWARNSRGKCEVRSLSIHGALRRQDTSVTPSGRYSARHIHQNSTREESKTRPRQVPLKARRSLTFYEEAKVTPKSSGQRDVSGLEADEVLTSAQNRLAQFRCQT